MRENDKEALIEDVSKELDEVDELLLVVIFDEDPHVGLMQLYKNILETILDGFKGPSAEKNFDFFQKIFDSALEAKGKEDSNALLQIQNDLNLTKVAEVSKELKDRLVVVSTPVADVLDVIYRLRREYNEQLKVVSQLEIDLETAKRQPGIRFNPVECRAPLLVDMDKRLAEASLHLKSIADELAKAEIEYNTKMAEYISSLNFEKKGMTPALEKWGKSVGDAKKIGFLQHCSLGLSQLLTRIFSAIQNFILEVSSPSNSKAYEQATKDLMSVFSIDDIDDEDILQSHDSSRPRSSGRP